jgi:hypothetical protein
MNMNPASSIVRPLTKVIAPFAPIPVTSPAV